MNSCLKKHDWKNVKNKTVGVKQFGQWKLGDKLVKCQIKYCRTKEANWLTTVPGIGLIFLCFGHGEDA